MEQLQTYTPNDTQKIATAISSGKKFYIKDGGKTYIATEHVFPFSEKALDMYLTQAENCQTYLTKEQSLARLSKI